MKRSDMLKVIENSIDEYDLEKHNCLSDLILCNIEEAGMMPPEDPTCNYSTKQAGEAFAWEKEND